MKIRLDFTAMVEPSEIARFRDYAHEHGYDHDSPPDRVLFQRVIMTEGISVLDRLTLMEVT